MTAETHASAPSVIPMLSYEDGPKALEWLASAFGFTGRARMVDPSGRLMHGEMEVEGGGLIMLATPSADYESRSDTEQLARACAGGMPCPG